MHFESAGSLDNFLGEAAISVEVNGIARAVFDISSCTLCRGAAFKLDIEHVEGNAEKPPDDAKTRRPHDVTMDTSRLEELGIAEHVEFARGIKEVLDKWVAEK